MSLIPVTDDITNSDSTQNELAQIGSSKTYHLDYANGKLGSIIDGNDAINQFIKKAISTERYRFLIYDDEFGCELEKTLLNNPTFDYLKLEIPRVISEAIEYDDRIAGTKNFNVDRNGSTLNVTFDVILVNGAVIEGVTVNV